MDWPLIARCMCATPMRAVGALGALLVSSALLLWGAPARAQVVHAVPPAPGSAAAVPILEDGAVVGAAPAPESRGLRLRFGAGANLPLVQRGAGYAQLDQLDVDLPVAGFEMMLELEAEIGRYLRVGGGLSYLHQWATRPQLERSEGDALSLENAFHFLSPQVALLVAAPVVEEGNRRMDFGVRASAGVGYVQWRLNDVGEHTYHARAGLALQYDYLARGTGFSLRAGYALTYIPTVGPLGLDFIQHGVVLNAALLRRF